MLSAIRYALRKALGIRSIIEIAKLSTVEAAAEEIERRGEKVNVSRISVMSGLNRREVTRILEGEEDKLDEDPYLPSRVIVAWEQTKRFCTKAGKPRVLSFGGEQSEFTELVRSVSKDVRPAAVLFELERMGVIEHSKQGIRLGSTERFHHKDPETGLDLLRQDTESLVEAVEENLFTKQQVRNLHLRTEFDNIEPAKLPEIKRWLREHGKHFHREVRDYLSKFDLDISPKKEVERGAKVVITAFSHTKTAV